MVEVRQIRYQRALQLNLEEKFLDDVDIDIVKRYAKYNSAVVLVFKKSLTKYDFFYHSLLTIFLIIDDSTSLI